MTIKKKLISAVLGIILVATGLVPMFAIDAYVTVIYRRIDIAFVNKSDSDLNSILSENNTDRNYYLVENYTMKKIRRLIIEENYDFAMKADLVVIDNNLDNVEAVDLYSTISSALEKQKEREKIIQEKKELELARFNAEKEKQKVVLEKTYDAVHTPDGEVVYVKNKEEKFSSTWWKGSFGMFDGNIISDGGSGFSSFRYGISSDFSFEHIFDKLLMGFDVGGQVAILPFSGDDKTMLGSFEIVPKIGFGKHLQLRTGVAGILRINTGDETTLQETTVSPLVGAGFTHLNMGKVEMNANFDYLFGHFAYSGLNLAMNSALNFAVPIAEMEKFKVTFNFGAKDTLFLKSSGVENRAGLILAIGVENVVK